ncbi:MAG: peptidylprolyl isomerase [Opitutaceae bacterium]|nr:peptidylprolyl isomerase [Cephaloticoccus sp.]MCP5529125.1 peptidylprolyl isomerase [Opitutaceae bacterium]
MKSRFLLLCLSLFVLGQARAETTIRVLMTTGLGEIELELYPDRAPLTVANFMRYVDRGFYEGGVFHRTVTPDNQPHNKVRIEVIQGGINPAKEQNGGPPITLERTNETGLKHLDGTISMARLEPDSATSDFFICINDQPELDFGGQRNPDGQGFAAFGRVVRGMDIARAIQRAPHEAQALNPPVNIVKVVRL